MSALPIYTAGLWRCCIDAIRSFAGMPDNGKEIACPVCGEKLRIRNGAWELVNPVPAITPLGNTRLANEAAD